LIVSARVGLVRARAMGTLNTPRVACKIVLPVLRDAGVVLRGWRSEDVVALEAACGDQEICRITTVPDRFTVEDALAWIARQQAHADRGSGAVLAIVPLSGERPVGMVGLFGLDEPGSTAQFGYWLVARWRGQGLASAAARMLAEWGFTERRLTAIHIDREPSNRASERVAEKLGAAVTGSRTAPFKGVEVELVRHTLNAPARHRAHMS
jgi:RimJ/RimL family protein N-acetyltransferase